VNFLNVGPWELVVILIIGILLVGPKRMAELARTIGRILAQLRSLSDPGHLASVLESITNLQSELEAADREADQTMEHITQGEMGWTSIQAEIEATSQATREVLEDIGRGGPGQEAG
jgi:Sec-independent protein translocase protein TatA